ncbi:hypothetical protein RUM44_011183 [Polyplax serrata]|uniref:Folded gastrulation N-terminal domain-containing protein n=1 Tax=Polyplax serrata TaxID=468196 RepID=A0ABR1APC4_POLSC
MICSLLIMTIIFINGIENAKQKVKHLDAVWKEDDIDAKTKAWLLMVETGKVDEEELRRITPKSIFIAPLLTNRQGKCQEGYRYDHLGQCVKVIKVDPKFQLEFLLKKLNSLYSEKTKPEEEEKPFSEPSTGPLQFSIPILNEDEREPVDIKPKLNKTEADSPAIFNTSSFVPEKPMEFIPVPLPMIMLNRTIEEKSNRTEEIEFSGMGPVNDTESFMASGFNYTDVSSGDYMPEEEVTTPDTLFLEDSD